MPIFDHRAEVFLIVTFASQLMQTLTFGFTKLAVLFLYKRIFVGKVFSITVWTMIGIVIVWTISFFFANLLQCLPITVDWTGWASTGCIETTKIPAAEEALAIWALQMSVKHKLAVMFMFLLGALTVGAGVAKLAVFYRIANNAVDLTYLLTPTIYWPMVESSLGVVGACLPLMGPVFTRFSIDSVLRGIRSRFSLSSTRGNSSNKQSEYVKGSKDSASSSVKDLARQDCNIYEGIRW
ncbi:hypothetical protein OEA41_000424 [Lepraria neglecta]|uniref:Rhodopsin domain-containing protein n=1 Tax=Lepraria neglecta TaxID=209136 RepID=A0AAD9ZFQ0_9LECA|nr:hypothetical protein OEA41_000424 [Lepraria neglecta]